MTTDERVERVIAFLEQCGQVEIEGNYILDIASLP